MLTDSQLTGRLFNHVRDIIPLSVMGKAPTLDAVRAVISADFGSGREHWRETAPKKVVSRFV
jgi:hypothetical protein